MSDFTGKWIKNIEGELLDNGENADKMVKLTRTKDINSFSDDIFDVLDHFYNNKNKSIKFEMGIIGSILNSIFTQQNPTFCLSYRIVENLIKQDKNLPFNSINGSQYKYVMRLLRAQNIFEQIRESSAKKPGLYDLKEPDLIKKLEEEIGKDVLSAKRHVNINWFDSVFNNKSDLVNSKDKFKKFNEKSIEEQIKIAKEIGKQRATERKRKKGDLDEQGRDS